MKVIRWIHHALKNFWQNGLPGWIFAVALTGTGVSTFWLAGLGYGKFLELWKEAGTAFVAMDAGLISAWLGYKGFKWWREKQEKEFGE